MATARLPDLPPRSCLLPCHSPPACPPALPASCPRLHSHRAEALGDDHHEERSGPHRRRDRIGRAGPTRSSSSIRRAPTTPSRSPRAFTDRVIVRAWPGYVAQKNYAASIASHDWILSLDADERVTPALAEEMQARLGDTPDHAAYRMPRVTWHLGRWIRTTDWYPDYQLRLYDRRTAEWTGRYVHEAVTVRGHRRTASRRASALRVSRHRRPSRDDRSLHDLCRAADARERPPRRRPAARSSILRWRFCATTSSAAAFGTAPSAWSSRS